MQFKETTKKNILIRWFHLRTNLSSKKVIYDKHFENEYMQVCWSLRAHLRLNFGIVKARTCIRKVLRKCVRRKTYQAPRFKNEPVTLPKDNVRETTVFELFGSIWQVHFIFQIVEKLGYPYVPEFFMVEFI